MKITENEVEVVKHQSVIAPLLLFLFVPLRRALFFPVIGAREPAYVAQEDMD